MPFPIYYMLQLSARVDINHLFKHTMFKNKLYVKELWRSLSKEGKKNTENGLWGKKRRLVNDVAWRRDAWWMKSLEEETLKGVKSFALLAKEKRKMTQQITDALEC